MMQHMAHFSTFSAFEQGSRDQLFAATGATPPQLDAFGDVSAIAPIQQPGEQPHFQLGAFGLMFMAGLGPHVDFMAETALEADDLNNLSIDLERMVLRWSNQSFFVQAGRMHTEIGFWNASYHHGRWLQPTIARPSVVAFEDDGGLIPAHAIGVAGGWQSPSSKGALHLVLTVANGRGDVPDQILLVRETNLAKQLVLSVFHTGVGVDGLRIGASVDYDHIAPAPPTIRPDLPYLAIDEYIANLNVAYLKQPWTVIAESFAFFHHSSGRTWPIYDTYAVLGRTFGSLTPYVELENRQSPNGLPPFFLDGTMPLEPNYTLELVGLRFETTRWSALRFEYSVQERVAGEKLPMQVELNWAFGV
jgi:hypothetical protein